VDVSSSHGVFGMVSSQSIPSCPGESSTVP
jgi:hypothetical protein